MNKPSSPSDWVSSSHFLGLFGIGAALVFLIQPMIGKLLLPKLGGGPNVWTGCLLFFQVGLLLGYVYAHLITRHLSAKHQQILHGVLLVGSLGSICFSQVTFEQTSATGSTWWIAVELFRTIGLPYIILSSTSPLLSAWNDRTFSQHNAYGWYIASNLGSLLACLVYPFGIEPWVTLSDQLFAWRFGYFAFAGLFLWATFRIARLQGLRLQGLRSEHFGISKPEPHQVRSPSLGMWVMWSLWAACTSILLAAITGKISQIGAIVPLLWILPLAIYLATWSIAFWVSWLGVFRIGIPVYLIAGLVTCFLLFFRLELSYLAQLTGYLFVIFATCLVCHSQLYASRPESDQLTYFYLAISMGGAVGSGFNAIVAPIVLDDYYELHIGIVLGACLLTIRFGQKSWSRIFSDDRLRRVTFPAVIMVPCILILLLASHASFQGNEIVVRKLRDTYGVVSVVEKPETGIRAMLHGGTQHGLQPIAGELSTQDTLYYRSESGVGMAIDWARSTMNRPVRFGVVGLGTGSLSLYVREMDSIVYYELSPAVCTIAKEEFRYLNLRPDATSIRLGDGRLLLASEQAAAPQQYDVLIADAFSNDSLPMHLLTKEAIALYRDSVAEDGIIAIHVTNRNLDLAPIVIAAARELGLRAALVESLPRIRWVILFPGSQNELPDWAGFPRPEARTARPWTDDYGSLFQVLAPTIF